MTLYVATISVLSDDFQRMGTSYNNDLGDTSKLNVIMTLRGEGLAHDANFNMDFEPSFLIVGLELVSTRSYTMQCKRHLRVSATVFKSRYDYQIQMSA